MYATKLLSMMELRLAWPFIPFLFVVDLHEKTQSPAEGESPNWQNSGAGFVLNILISAQSSLHKRSSKTCRASITSSRTNNSMRPRFHMLATREPRPYTIQKQAGCFPCRSPWSHGQAQAVARSVASVLATTLTFAESCCAYDLIGPVAVSRSGQPRPSFFLTAVQWRLRPMVHGSWPLTRA